MKREVAGMVMTHPRALFKKASYYREFPLRMSEK
jgi:hypothetical protein